MLKVTMCLIIVLSMGIGQYLVPERQGDVRLAPKMLNYQGYITDTLYNPVNDSLNMVFRIYAASSGGNPIWAETQLDVPVLKGIFHVLLGSVTPIPDTVFTKGTDRWLETVLGAQTMSPRTRITAAPYAYTADYADTASYALSSAPDNDWVRGTPDSVLFTIRQLGLARSGNTLLGTDPFTYVNFGVNCSTGTAGLQTSGITVSGGMRNAAFREYSTVAGGYYNRTTLRYSTIGGGDNNRGYGDGSTIAGGHDNEASGYGTFVGGGGVTGLWPSGNTAGGNYSAVVGGLRNRALADYAFIGAGNYDTVMAVYGSALSGLRNQAGATAVDSFAVVVGGRDNEALDRYTFIGGGSDNHAPDYGGTVAGGCQDSAGGFYSTVGGGWNNRTFNNYGVVGGGANNTAENYGATVAGGWDNHAKGWGSVVCGGGVVNLTPSGNTADSAYSAVVGGIFNRAVAKYAFVGGGYFDSVTAMYGTIGGGYNNNAGLFHYDTAAVVCGGARNRARYHFAAILGGADNYVGGYYGTVGGGSGDSAVGNYAAVCGGSDNYASGASSFIGGGTSNRLTGGTGVICGGYDNYLWGSYSFIGGGYRNLIDGNECTIGGGIYNGIDGSIYYCTIPGGGRDSIFSDYGFATNYRSLVPSGFTHSAAFNGTTVTASSQLRCGTLAKTGGSFTIDHPLDPENKILNHYFVESPDMSNLYQGDVVLNPDGRAEVVLPDYFSALNRDPRIQLTGVGTYEVYVAEDFHDNRFAIGGKPGTKVYWQVTGSRNDQSARIIETIMPVEQVKTGLVRERMLDDDFLLTTMDQLDRMGVGDQFRFRTEAGRRAYEEMKREEAERGE